MFGDKNSKYFHSRATQHYRRNKIDGVKDGMGHWKHDPKEIANDFLKYFVMQRRCVEAESITHKYCNSSTKPKFYKNTRLIGKIIKKTSLANFYSKTHIT